MYDIIGDIHGHASLLKKLLVEMGYQKGSNGYFHPERKPIFAGDFINRGPEIRKTVRIVRNMVENGNAHAILGNHEIYAIIYYLKDKNGKPLIKSPEKNVFSMGKTINQFNGREDEWKSHRKWMAKLPLYLDLGDIRVVHACWSDEAIEILKLQEQKGKSKKNLFRKLYKNPKSKVGKSLNILTKGIDFRLPGDLRITNNKGVSPRSFRMRWWEVADGKTFEEMSFESKFRLPAYDIPRQLVPEHVPYPADAPIVFFGHYCRMNGPHIITPNLCCVDSCVVNSKTITAYRWSGETSLEVQNLLQIKR